MSVFTTPRSEACALLSEIGVIPDVVENGNFLLTRCWSWRGPKRPSPSLPRSVHSLHCPSLALSEAGHPSLASVCVTKLGDGVGLLSAPEKS